LLGNPLARGLPLNALGPFKRGSLGSARFQKHRVKQSLGAAAVVIDHGPAKFSPLLVSESHAWGLLRVLFNSKSQPADSPEKGHAWWPVQKFGRRGTELLAQLAGLNRFGNFDQQLGQRLGADRGRGRGLAVDRT